MAWAKFLNAPFAELNAPKFDLPLKEALAPVKIRVPAVFSFKKVFITSFANRNPPKQPVSQLSLK